MYVFPKRLARAVCLSAAVTAVGVASVLLQPTTVTHAASPAHLPARCFAPAGVHIVFGPQSFFLPKTTQGPTSFRENTVPNGPTEVTYPLYQGTSQGRNVFYVITDASELSVAQTLGVNYVPKLAHVAGTAAVQNSTSEIGTGRGIDFPASVDFSPQRILVPGPAGFPPLAAQPGAVGEPGYSPLVQVNFRGTIVVLNAPQIANATGMADRVVNLDNVNKTLTYRETDGCYDNESVHYASFDASDSGAAAIEDATYTPNLNAAPSEGCADAAVPAPNCSREPLIAFTNGQTGVNNPERQGLNAAILDHITPLNILKEVPEPTSQFDYSPVWEPHLETWTPAAVAAGLNVRQTDYSTAQQLTTGTNNLATGFPPPAPFGPNGFVVNCPVVSLDVNP